LSQIRRGVRLPRFRELESDVRRRTVTKQDFVDAVADRAGMSKRDAGAAVDAMLETITAALRSRDTVTFTGFGKFSTSARAARMGVNPRTGAKVMIAATTVPKFSAGSTLKAAVKGG
jgi:DNA-binding protein HU-beta